MQSNWSRLVVVGLCSLCFRGVLSSQAEAPSSELARWKPQAPAPALMPLMEVDTGSGILKSSARGHFRVNGSWRRAWSVTAGTHYRIRAEYQARNVDLIRRSILIRVDWQDKESKRVGQPDYPGESDARQQGWNVIEGVFQAPEEAATAVIDLVFRWDDDGVVQWKDTKFERSSAPGARPVVLAAVNFRPRQTTSPEENLRLFRPFVQEAARLGADIVCLPEGITLVGTSRSYREVAEPIPGPSTNYLGQVAREHSIYIVAGILEKDGETVYNTAVLVDRQGKLAGFYRKVSLPREEIEGGITPGQEFPVFTTDFGKVGLMICWDLHFPEAARRLAAGGAEVILLPIWGGSEMLYPARAIENQVYLVSSSYDSITGIWDRRGQMVAGAAREGSVAVYRVDLNEKVHWDWLGDYRARIAREAPPVREQR